MLIVSHKPTVTKKYCFMGMPCIEKIIVDFPAAARKINLPLPEIGNVHYAVKRRNSVSLFPLLPLTKAILCGMAEFLALPWS